MPACENEAEIIELIESFMQPNVLLQGDLYLHPAVKGLALEIAYLIPRLCIKSFTVLYCLHK